MTTSIDAPVVRQHGTDGVARLRLNPAIGRAEFNAQRIVNARIQGMLAEPPEPGL